MNVLEVVYRARARVPLLNPVIVHLLDLLTSHPLFCLEAALELHVLDRSKEFRALPAFFQYVDQDAFSGECTTWLQRDGPFIAAEEPQTWL